MTICKLQALFSLRFTQLSQSACSTIAFFFFFYEKNLKALMLCISSEKLVKGPLKQIPVISLYCESCIQLLLVANVKVN